MRYDNPGKWLVFYLIENENENKKAKTSLFLCEVFVALLLYGCYGT